MEKGKPSFSGLEIVRRDNCKLLKQVQTDFGEDYLADRVRNGYSGTVTETTVDADGGAEAGEDTGGKAAKKGEKAAAGSGDEQALFAQEAHEAIRPAVNAELGD